MHCSQGSAPNPTRGVYGASMIAGFKGRLATKRKGAERKRKGKIRKKEERNGSKRTKGGKKTPLK